MWRLSFLVMAILSGVLLPIRYQLDGKLAQATGSLPMAGVVSTFVGATVLVALLLSGRFGSVYWAGLRLSPWWSYLGGVSGGSYVLLVTYAAIQAGTTLTIGIGIATQMLSSLLVDHFGWLGLERRPLSWQRLLAGILLVVAVVLLLS